jgi:dTDP-4-amino-4,6-dideoxygalactose transaminase
MSKDIKTFHKDFTRQEAIPGEGIQRALEIMQSGKLHRYNVGPGEVGEAALLEKEFAEYMGAKYCLACASCGSAMYLALKSIGVKPGDKVLCNAFTLAPVPGAIENSGAVIELVEITEDYTIDLEDLERKAQKSESRFFLMSHMRGHIAKSTTSSSLKIALIPWARHGVGEKAVRSGKSGVSVRRPTSISTPVKGDCW